jgi:DNA-binding XRE family transcriptional regulator
MPLDGNKLKKLRLQHNFSRFQLSLELDVSPSTIEKIENGYRPGNLKTAQKLAKFFNVTIEELI